MTLETKILEVRDEGTFIPCLAVRMATDDPIEGWYLHRRCGYPVRGSEVMVTHLNGEHNASADPYHWRGRTWPVAHTYIRDHFAELKSGDVVDVSYILGETAEPKKSERFEAP